jgi:hypothetical protein
MRTKSRGISRDAATSTRLSGMKECERCVRGSPLPLERKKVGHSSDLKDSLELSRPTDETKLGRRLLRSLREVHETRNPGRVDELKLAEVDDEALEMPSLELRDLAVELVAS